MADDDGLDALSSQELHDIAVKRARRHFDAKFFYTMMKLLPVAESAAGEYEKSDDDILRLSAHFDDQRLRQGRGRRPDAALLPRVPEEARRHR